MRKHAKTGFNTDQVRSETGVDALYTGKLTTKASYYGILSPGEKNIGHQMRGVSVLFVVLLAVATIALVSGHGALYVS